MSSTFIALAVAIILTVGLVVHVFIFNLLLGSFEFLLGKPRFQVLKSKNGLRGFAFGLNWNEDKEPANLNFIRLKLFNPFGQPSQVDLSFSFDSKDKPFGLDLDCGVEFEKFISTMNAKSGSILVEISDTKTGVNFQFDMSAKKFMGLRQNAQLFADEYTQKYETKEPVIYYSIPKRSFIADPLPGSDKKLKLATNPEFSGEFATAGAGSGASGAANFAVSKVWIEPGCIVCDACETIYPEVFDVQEKTCIIRPGAPLTDGLKIQEAAEACPVEVIKFSK